MHGKTNNIKIVYWIIDAIKLYQPNPDEFQYLNYRYYYEVYPEQYPAFREKVMRYVKNKSPIENVMLPLKNKSPIENVMLPLKNKSPIENVMLPLKNKTTFHYNRKTKFFCYKVRI